MNGPSSRGKTSLQASFVWSILLSSVYEKCSASAICVETSNCCLAEKASFFKDCMSGRVSAWPRWLRFVAVGLQIASAHVFSSLGGLACWPVWSTVQITPDQLNLGMRVWPAQGQVGDTLLPSRSRGERRSPVWYGDQVDWPRPTSKGVMLVCDCVGLA